MSVPLTPGAIPVARWAPDLVQFYEQRHQERPAPTTKHRARFHHTVTLAPDQHRPFVDEDQAMRTLHDIGVARFGSGVSYAYCIMPTGRVYQGMRSDTKQTQSGHTPDANYVELGVAFVGNYEESGLTRYQVQAAGDLLALEHIAGRLIDWTPHWHEQVYATSCPGVHAIASMPAIRDHAASIIEGDLVPISDDDLDRIADRVWDRVVGRDRAGHPRAASWLLTSAQRMAARAAEQTTDDPVEE